MWEGLALPQEPSRALTFDRRGSIIQVAHHKLACNAVMRTSSPATAAREGASGTGSAPLHGLVNTTSERSPQRRTASMGIRAAPVTAPHEDAFRHRGGRRRWVEPRGNPSSHWEEGFFVVSVTVLAGGQARSMGGSGRAQLSWENGSLCAAQPRNAPVCAHRLGPHNLLVTPAPAGDVCAAARRCSSSPRCSCWCTPLDCAPC